MARLLWLADELEQAGLKVVRVAGWETRGRTVGFDPRCVVDHHTAGSATAGPNPSLGIVTYGRPGVPPPLCNILIGRDSVVWVIAAGISNNAGEGGWPPVGASHNRHTIGVEVEHAGRLDLEQINLDQLWTLALVDAVICRHYGWDAGRCVAHKEWAPSRKVDPVWPQDAHRSRVALLLNPPALLVKEGPMPIADAINIVRQTYWDAWGHHGDPEGLIYWSDRVQREGFAGWASLIRALATVGASA